MLIYRNTLQGLYDGRLSPDESLQVVQHYINKGFRGMIFCKINKLLGIFAVVEKKGI